MESGSLADRISALREQAIRERESAAKNAGFTVLCFLMELDSVATHDIKLGAYTGLLRAGLILTGTGSAWLGVRSALDSAQAGHEAAALTAEQVRQEPVDFSE